MSVLLLLFSFWILALAVEYVECSSAYNGAEDERWTVCATLDICLDLTDGGVLLDVLSGVLLDEVVRCAFEAFPFTHRSFIVHLSMPVPPEAFSKVPLGPLGVAFRLRPNSCRIM